MSETKPVLALDMDDVVKQFARPCAQYINSNFGMELDISRMSLFFDAEEMGLEHDEAVRRMISFHTTGESASAPPIEESVEDIALLAQDFDLQIVTARQSRFKDITEEWVAQHYPDSFSVIHLANHYSQEGVRRTKLEICREIGAVGLVDDSGSHITEVADDGMLGFLFRLGGAYSWNRNVPAHPNIIEVHRLREVHDFLKNCGVVSNAKPE